MGKKVLFISGCAGLGHITRDLDIAKALRTLSPGLEISWLAEFPATTVLKEFRETILPESELFNFGTALVEGTNKGFKSNMIEMSMEWFKVWPKNVEAFMKVMAKGHYDLVIGDEIYYIHTAIVDNPAIKTTPMVGLYDFVGHEALTMNPMEHGAEYEINKLWLKNLTSPNNLDKALFIGEPEDIRDEPFWYGLPNMRQTAKEHMDFIGYIAPDDITNYSDKSYAKKLLGYGSEPLIICTIGGTNIGVPLLNLCVESYALMKKELPDLRLVLVGGPAIAPESIKAPDGVKIYGYLPRLYRHMGAADLNVVVGGGTTTVECMALGRPFIYFPITEHFEQKLNALRCQRYNAGVKMDFHSTTPELLAKTVLENIDKKVNYGKIPIDGAEKAARICHSLIGS